MRLAREQTACTWQRTASSNGSDESASVCVNQECYCTKQQTIDLYPERRRVSGAVPRGPGVLPSSLCGLSPAAVADAK